MIKKEIILNQENFMGLSKSLIGNKFLFNFCLEIHKKKEFYILKIIKFT